MKHVFEIETQVGDLRNRTIAKSGKHPWVKHYQTAIYAQQHFNIGRHKSPVGYTWWKSKVQGSAASASSWIWRPPWLKLRNAWGTVCIFGLLENRLWYAYLLLVLLLVSFNFPIFLPFLSYILYFLQYFPVLSPTFCPNSHLFSSLKGTVNTKTSEWLSECVKLWFGPQFVTPSLLTAKNSLDMSGYLQNVQSIYFPLWDTLVHSLGQHGIWKMGSQRHPS